MNIIVLGSDGMLGKHLVEGWGKNKITAWDREDLDITDEIKVREMIVNERPDVVINAAAYTDVDGAEREREEAFAVNEIGVRNIAKAVKDIGAVMVHYSTDYVFPGDKKQGHVENDPPGPAVNAYGESKLAGERALKEVGAEFYLIRTAWLYGSGGKNFVDTMVSQVGNKKRIRVVDDQHGSPTYAIDLAEATKRLVKDKYALGIYHLVNEGVVTWCDLAKTIFELLEADIEVQPVSSEEFLRPAKRPQWSVLKNTNGPRLRKWEEGLAEYLGSSAGDKVL